MDYIVHTVAKNCSLEEIFVKTFDEILHSLVFFYRNLFAQSATTFLRKEINILVFFIGFL